MKKQIIALFSAMCTIGCLLVLLYVLESPAVTGVTICQKLCSGDVALWFVCLVLLIALVVFGWNLLMWVCRAGHKNQFSQHAKLLGSIMFLLWSFGWILFIKAFLCFPNCHQFVHAELLLRSAIASLNMFMLNIDSNVLDLLKDQPLLKGVISFVGVLSFLCTIGLLLSLVSARLWTYIKLRRTKVKKDCPHFYLFFGISEQTEILAKSVRDNDSDSVRIVVEQTPKSNDEEKEGWNHFVGMMTHRRESFQKVWNMGVQLSLTSVDPSDIDISQIDVFGEANLDMVKKKICKLSEIRTDFDKKLHIFFLSNNEEKNILSTAIIREDETIKKASSQGVHVIIYCHARYDSVNRVVEESNPLRNVEVRIIDSSRLSIELLKRSVENHPVKFVDIDGDNNPGTVRSAFNSLVVGFGETGRDATRFLYEYGAFMSNDSNNEVVKRSEFHCYVVDKNMDTKEGTFINSASEALKAINTDGTNMVQLIKADTASVDFYNLLEKIASSLNYVVVSQGNDIENMTMAVRILKFVMANGNDMKKFRILIRICNNAHLEHFRKITNHYNQSTKHPMCMEVFGAYKDIFSYSFIVADQFREEAKEFYNSYQNVMQENEPALKSGTWEERRDELLGFCQKVVTELPTGNALQKYNEGKPINEKKSPTGLYMGFEYVDIERTNYPKYENLRKLRRQTEQDMSNAWHKLTKKELMEESMNQNSSFSDLNQKILQLDDPEADVEYRHRYDNLGKHLSKMILNLAITEHLRWNASHEMLGYKKGITTDEKRQLHNCLVDWKDLKEVSDRACNEAMEKVQKGEFWDFELSKQLKSEYPNYKEKVKAYVLYLPDYKKYDFAVVETTISLLKKDEELK